MRLYTGVVLAAHDNINRVCVCRVFAVSGDEAVGSAIKIVREKYPNATVGLTDMQAVPDGMIRDAARLLEE